MNMVPLPTRIEDWAKTNEFQLVGAERRWFFVGPFSLRKNVGKIYRIVVRGRDGDMGEGWLSLQNDYAGQNWEEVKWIRKPAHTVEPRPEDVMAQQFLGVAKMTPTTGKWSFGFVMAFLFVGWGLGSLLAYGGFVVPGRGSFVMVGIPAWLLALGVSSFGLAIHLVFFWNVGPKSSPNARMAIGVLFVGGIASMLLGLCIQLLSFLIKLAG